MTNDKIALQALLEKTSDASMLRDMISFAADRRPGLSSRRCQRGPDVAKSSPAAGCNFTDQDDHASAVHASVWLIIHDLGREAGAAR